VRHTLPAFPSLTTASLATATLTTAMLLVSTVPASAHAELAPWRLPPNTTAGVLLLVTHGCGDEDEWISSAPLEEEPTIAVTLLRPLELRIEPAPYEGWTLSTERDEAGEVVSATWRSDDPAGTSDTLQLPFDATVGDVPDGHTIWLPVVQECTGGDSLEWTLEGDLRGGDEVPAMELAIVDGAPAPDPHGGEGLDAASGAAAEAALTPSPVERFGWASVLLGGAGLVAIGVALWSRRRTRAGATV
jgi:uncharacterized protein YcnI